MTFKEALNLIDENKNLIGKKFRGATIDEFLVAPTDSVQRDQFSRLYIDSLNAQQSALPFINSDVDVLVVCDKHRIRQENFIATMTLFSLLSMTNEIS